MSGNPAWKPGQSGNPTGTSRGQRAIARSIALHIQEETRDLREVTDFALAVLRWNPTNQGSFEAVYGPIVITTIDKRWAAELILERGAGRPLQTIEMTVDGPAPPALVLSAVTDADLDAAERVLRESGAGGPGDVG